MSQSKGLKFNPPPGWPKPPSGWTPPKEWVPDPAWPEPPSGWQLWVPADDEVSKTGPTPVHLSGTAPESSLTANENVPRDLARRLALLETENAALRARLETIGIDAKETVQLDDDRIIQDVGIYRYHHPLESALAYKGRLDDIETRIAEMVKADVAIEKSNLFTFNGSLAQGRRMANDLASLMLRAYNAEADNAVRSLRVGNVMTAKKRLEASRTAIARLGKLMEMRLSDAFHMLRIEELELVADYLMKKQEEREAERDKREKLREEKKVALELAAQRERLEKEREHIATALEKLHETGSADPDLERKLGELNDAIAQNDYRAANIRAGYIYVISNRGAFGDHVVKIGLTRRLDPLERISELGDASVPFRFDLHALYFSEDAVTLEAELHQHFSERRVNWANMRREFFFALPAEVRVALAEKVGNLLEFVEHGESTEYLQSVHYWPSNIAGPGPGSGRVSQ